MKNIDKKNSNKPHKPRALTQSQEKYVQELSKGTPRFEAFQIAYPTSLNWKRDSVDQAAYQELNKPHVRARYDELKKKVDSRVETIIVRKRVWTTEMAIEKLTNLAEQAEKEIKESEKVNMTRVQAILGAVKELNSMHGYNEKNITATNKVVIVGSEEDLED